MSAALAPNAPLSTPGRNWRRGAWLVLGVTLLHLWLANHALLDQLGSGAALSTPRRIEVSFVRELVQQAPPALVAPVAPRRAAAGIAAAPAASAPAPVPEVLAVPEVAAAVPLPPTPAEPAPAETTPVVAAAAVEAPASAAAAPAVAFEWPPSTRLTYAVTGYYRGPVEGQAQVEWLRMGARYQVHLDVSLGPSFAPLMSRRMSSDGELTASGLRPRRYDEQTRVAMRSPRVATVHFDDDKVRLAVGSEVALPAGVQDTASQFVQMTWMFTTKPELLEVGRTITMPLALPRRVDTWLYDVVARETLATPVGPVATLHVKPRREVGGGDLTAEMWVAPTLQYLPVRILIRQDRETYIDMLLERLPQQGSEGGAASAPTKR